MSLTQPITLEMRLNGSGSDSGAGSSRPSRTPRRTGVPSQKTFSYTLRLLHSSEAMQCMR